ncbi:MAG: sulfotransferase, partial [Pseudomonadota bacterium]
VGLPRSGTTLIEQILSMAPGVHPCGELVTTERLLRELFEGDGPVDPAQAADFAATYREHLPDLPADTDKFIDKMPANFRYVGLLLAAFPSGKIIDVQRDPRDVALSMWTTRFSAKGMNYASTIPAIADQANLYRSYMAHWKAIFPTRILNVSYEDLVSNVEDETQRMAAFCGIDWTSEMQNPERNTNPVTTASVNQVRTGIHQRSVGRWEILGENLDLLISRLDPELWPDVDPDASRGSADAAGPPL